MYRTITPGISRTNATRPSPSMVAPAKAVTCLKLVSRLLITTCCCDSSSSTDKPTRLPSASTIMSSPFDRHGRARQGRHLPEVGLQTLDHDLLLRQQFIDRQADPFAVRLDDHEQPVRSAWSRPPRPSPA